MDTTAEIEKKVLYQIKSEGVDISEQYYVEVTSIVVSREVGHIPCATLHITDGDSTEKDFEIASANIFAPGKSIEVLAGLTDTADKKPIFKGIVTKQSLRARNNGLTKLIVELKHPLYTMTLGRKSKVFKQKDDADVISELLLKPTTDAKITADVTGSGSKHERLVQFNTTDWDFMMTRVDATASLCFVEDDEIIIKAPEIATTADLELGFAENLLEFDATLDTRTQPGEVKATRWIPSEGAIKLDDGGKPSDGPGELTSKELADITAFETDTIHYSGTRFKTDNLQPLAIARMQRYNLSKVRGVGKITGNDELKPGMTVLLKGMGKYHNGLAFVAGIRHVVTDGYWHTHVQFGLSPKFHTERYDINAPRAAGVAGAVSGIQIGIVTKLFDPDHNQGLERVAVELPALGDNTEVWARLSSVYAGGGEVDDQGNKKPYNKRGFVFRPEEGDEVLVGFIDDDPTQAVVLGSLFHNNNCTAPITAEEFKEANNKKGIFSRSGMEIVFDDSTTDKPKLTIKSLDGREIILDDDTGKSITIKDKKNSIVMNDDGITIESSGDITMKANNTILLDATTLHADLNANWLFEAPAGSLKATGQNELLGKPIKLND